MQKLTIGDFNKQFPDDNACLDWLRHHLYPAKIFCIKCKKPTKFHRVKNRKVYECDNCGQQISPTSGTIFHKSPTPLRFWFYAIFLMASTRTGISAKQLQRELGVTYKTAWRMFTQIRKLMDENSGPLFGEIEADETYIGGKQPGKRGRGAAGKTIVAGIVERGGKAVVQVVPDVKANTLIPIIQEHIPAVPGTVIYTDEMPSYNRLTSLGYAHGTVQHAAKEYVRGAVHTQTIDGLWSNVKRGIDGVNHAVSPQHLQSYLDAYVFRYNHRTDSSPMVLTMLEQIAKDT
jgi:transposase-like protein